LAADESPYVFDAYWQAQRGQRKTGTGLGLAIVKGIAVAHGGNVSVRSQVGQGSTFSIMIPVKDEPPVVENA
jgi:signal transduction histidine kinase